MEAGWLSWLRITLLYKNRTNARGLLITEEKMSALFVLATSFFLVSCVLFNAVAQNIDPTCEPCAVLKCKNGQNCTREPVSKCPPLGVCRGKIVKDHCGCCDICVTTIGHKCRDDPEAYQEQVCGKGLRCVQVEESLGFEVGIEKRRSCRCEKEIRGCFDPVNKKNYRPGEIWTRGDFACEVCVCNSNGRPKCSSLRCRKTTCFDVKRVEDRCCAFCMKDDWSKGLPSYVYKKKSNNLILC
ncbi:kielin/chordin-like protein [Actinia tenebrosa]|uniref:Kielin/chordin-like protein n=1 Tax=Actinia tenebrosa TaxID=6105 RepID=A0A6P8IFS3_ACTTE|nr:kielin/chordin-like protein [Actinia tenebrosa]